MSDAVSGHGALLAVESNPTLSPGVFTTIAELTELKPPALSRPTSDVTPTNETIGSKLVGNVIQRDDLTGSCNFIFNNPTHDHLTGMYSFLKDGLKRGWRLRGPSGTTSTNEWIMSGALSNVDRTNPINSADPQKINFSVTLSGPMIIDGVTWS